MQSSFSEMLHAHLKRLFVEGQSCPDHSWPKPEIEAHKAIIDLVKSIVPAPIMQETNYSGEEVEMGCQWNQCRKEILEKINPPSS